MDAVIMAGTHKDKARHIKGKNKAFLKINNKPTIFYIISALEKAKSIDKIHILGPKKQLSKITNHEIIEELPAEKKMSLTMCFLQWKK